MSGLLEWEWEFGWFCFVEESEDDSHHEEAIRL